MAEIKCPSCGSPNVEQIDTNKYQCPYCGNTFTTQQVMPQQQQSQQPSQLSSFQNQTVPDDNDNPGCLMNGLCFCIPLVGIIMYFVKKDTQPICAKSYLQWALLSIVIGVIIEIISSF